MNGALLLIRCLEAEGVLEAWGYPGGAIMPVYDALLESEIKHYLCRHEQGAGFAAQGQGRATGKAGVCIATSGPGATNLVTAIADAQMDSAPMVAITGQVASHLIGTDAFQEADVIGVTLPIVKHSWQIRSAEEIPRVVREAFDVAERGRPGPVLIDFPKDIQVSNASGLEPISQQPVIRVEAVDDEVESALKSMREAKQPIIYTGGGVRIAGAWPELRRLAEATNMPVVHTLQGLGGLDSNDPRCLGMLGMHGSKAANLAVQNSDLLVAIGARFDDRVTGKLDEFAPNASIVHIDIDAAELGKLRRAQAPVCADLAPAMDALSRQYESGSDLSAWWAQIRSWQEEFPKRYDAPFGSIYAPRLLRDLSRRVADDHYVCCDVGQHQMWVAQHWSFRHPRQHLTSGGLGTMGFGLPAAMGVKIAHPDAEVICVSGDGSIMMNIQELATLNRYGIGVKILLLDNSALGMVRQWQELFFAGRESEIDLSDNPDFEDLAKVFGLHSMVIEQAGECEDAIDEFLAHNGPVLLRAKIDRLANVWPLVPPNTANHDMLDQEEEQGTTAIAGAQKR
ncbi:MAG: acetolactate synthase 2 catalytic subunit [Planctomycetota bacterium]